MVEEKISQEVLMMVDMFDCLDGQRQLELLGILIEKLENGEIELNGKQITPEELGIDDACVCYTTILDMISVEGKLTDHQTQG
ncbi:hypothetical protein UNSWDHB_2224 [Dehalobacter sp. UNSWDHB]|uniref:hypothetical protein n=1 Tax=Dehalobacter TaxID=56112 RepID=UPI00028B2ECB|nr:MULTISPECIES: hypothetical protein [unclassified Dehalobacter]AFV02312.1 hypothetical protein DHBDCA_p1283 [Dehalobacter sp. DCA]AFV05355.1 hypothetical protein DCF50_p1349 [Dehalobacter sp. CF]EQB20489.1 hypothetical protein UNSWDHB_2224 [Dehalobacter sp. UNSWDHB]